MLPNRVISVSLLTLVACLMLAACGSSESGNANEPAGDAVFDLDEVGMRGMEWTGDATLLGPGLEFDSIELQMATIGFYLFGDHRDLTEFDDPPLEFRGEPVTMALRMSGVVQDHEPGRVTVEITSIRPTFSGGVGTSSAEKLVEDLANNGVTIPEASSDDPATVTFQVAAVDEDYEEINLTADVDWIHTINAREGDRQSL